MRQLLKDFDRSLVEEMKGVINQNILHTIYDQNCQIIACSNLAAQSVGFNTWNEAVGISYQDTDNLKLMTDIFGCTFNNLFADKIVSVCRKIYKLQKEVLNNNRIINYIDYMPYNEKFVPYLITCVPITRGGKPIGVQSFAQKCNYINMLHHSHIINNLLNIELETNHCQEEAPNINLTRREHEIIFLLANGLSTEDIFPLLRISKSTISNIITSRLSPKFGLLGSNTKLLANIAKTKGYHKIVPESLSNPCIITLCQ